MSQQINLINPSLIKKKDFFTTANIVVLHGFMGVVMLAWFFSLKNELAPLKITQMEINNQLDAMQQTFNQMQLARNTGVDTQVIQQIKLLESKKMQQSAVIKQLAEGQASAQRGVAPYMRGLASQTMASVWLTGFSIDQTQHAVTLKGRSLHADLLPSYIQKLGFAEAFKGQAFGGLQITTPKSVDNNIQVKAQTESKSQLADKPTLPSFVEFELQAYEVKTIDGIVNSKG